MQGHHKIALLLAVALIAGCRTERPPSAPVPLANTEPATEGTPVGDDRTAMEAAIDASPSAVRSAPEAQSGAPREGMALAPNAPDSYVVKHGDTLWGLPRCFYAILGIGPRSGRSTLRSRTRT